MPYFGVQVDDTIISNKFFEKVKEAGSKNDFIKNPFEGKVLELEKGIYAIILEPLYPKIYYAGFFLLFASFLFTQKVYSGFHIPGLIALSIYFFWSNTFYKIMLRIGLFKSGYRGKIKFFSLKKICMRWLIKWVK